MKKIKLKFLGKGTSQGVPVIGCNCEVCVSEDSKDKRYRSSSLITTESGKKILIDCGPDFRMQMLANKEDHLDAIMLTHEHNDHVIGLDDVRPLIFRTGKDMEIYCAERVGNELKIRFAYAFSEDKYPGAPSFELHEITGDFDLFDAEVIPVEVMHYKLPILGYRIGRFAYITDALTIPESEYEKLKDIDVLVVNALRKKPHLSHQTLADALRIIDRVGPREAYLVHMSHHMGLTSEVEKELPAHVHFAYDGLVIDSL